MTTISSGATTLTPRLVLGYSSTRESGNLLHNIIGRPDPDVTLKPAGLRTGTLGMLFTSLADALAMENLHAQAAVLTLVDSDLPALGMEYVASGSINLELDQESNFWMLSVDFQEVS